MLKADLSRARKLTNRQLDACLHREGRHFSLTQDFCAAHLHRQKDRQAGRPTGRHTHRHRQTQTDTADTDRHGQTQTDTNKHKHRQTRRHTNTQTDRHPRAHTCTQPLAMTCLLWRAPHCSHENGKSLGGQSATQAKIMQGFRVQVMKRSHNSSLICKSRLVRGGSSSGRNLTDHVLANVWTNVW